MNALPVCVEHEVFLLAGLVAVTAMGTPVSFTFISGLGGEFLGRKCTVELNGGDCPRFDSYRQ